MYGLTATSAQPHKELSHKDLSLQDSGRVLLRGMSSRSKLSRTHGSKAQGGTRSGQCVWAQPCAAILLSMMHEN